MADFFLVHGSCHGAWCWRDVIPALEGLGHSARAIDLPGHGGDDTPISEITLDSYAEAINAAAEQGAILVGHSAGGYAIAAAAEAAPERIGRLVFLCAYAPLSGLSLIEMRKQADRQPLLEAITVAKDGASWSPLPEKARETFYHDCPEEACLYAMERIVPEPTVPQNTPLVLSPAYDALPKSYIRCTDDRTIPPEAQQIMANRLPEQDRWEMQTSHSPFFADPAGLAQVLDMIAAPR